MNIIIDIPVRFCQTVAMETHEPIRAVCRALDVLKAINRLRGGTLAEIAKASDLPYATCFRIVQTLIHEGMVAQEPFRKRYRATDMVLALSAGYQADDRLVSAARQPMEAFTARHLWPLGLTIRVGSRMLMKHTTHALTTQTFEVYHPGDSQPIAESASGRVWLAFCSKEERDMVLEGLTGQDPDSSLGLRLLRELSLLDAIRAQGYASYERTPFNRTPGQTSAIAVPLLWDGRVHGALTMVFFASAMPLSAAIARYVDPMQDLAGLIAARACPQP